MRKGIVTPATIIQSARSDHTSYPVIFLKRSSLRKITYGKKEDLNCPQKEKG